MTVDALYLGIVLAGALLLFYKGWVRTDVTALLVMSSLMMPWLPGPDGPRSVLPVEVAVSGFGSPAVVMVAAMFVLSAAMVKTGAARMIGDRLLRRCAKTELGFQLAVLALVTLFSGVMNDTTTVLIWMPILLVICREHGYSPSRLLILLAFASLLGGQWTLIGTRSNIVVSDYLQTRAGRGFGFFELTPIAAAVWAACLAFFVLFGRRLLPEKRTEASRAERYEIEEYMTEVMAGPDQSTAGRTLGQLDLERRCGVTILSVVRGEQRVAPYPHLRLAPGDVLVLQGTISRIAAALAQPGLEVKEELRMGDRTLHSVDLRMVEALLPLDSELVGTTLAGSDFPERYRVSVLAIGRRGRSLSERPLATRLEAGDSLLLVGHEPDLERLGRDPNLYVLEARPLPVVGRAKAFLLLFLMAFVVGASASRLLAPSLAIPLAALLAVLLRCISVREAYAGIDLHTLVIVGGLIPFGLALERTGTAHALGEAVAAVLGQAGPGVILAALLAVTVVLTQLVENTAVAIIVAPIAYELAVASGGDPRRFCLGVAICVSSAFMTPVAHESTILVMGPGRYVFRDYLKLGTPMAFLTWLVTCLWLAS